MKRFYFEKSSSLRYRLLFILTEIYNGKYVIWFCGISVCKLRALKHGANTERGKDREMVKKEKLHIITKFLPVDWLNYRGSVAQKEYAARNEIFLQMDRRPMYEIELFSSCKHACTLKAHGKGENGQRSY